MFVCVSLTVGMCRYVCVCMSMCEYLCVCVGDVYSVLNIMCPCACMSFYCFIFHHACLFLSSSEKSVQEKSVQEKSVQEKSVQCELNYPRELDKKSKHYNVYGCVICG